MKQIEKRLGTTASKYGYLEALPECYDAYEKMPLLIFMHGFGEVGNGKEDLHKLTNTGLPQIIQSGRIPAGLENFIVLSLQSKTKSIPAANINAFIDYAAANYKVDPTRIYGTGLSGGSIALDGYIKAYNRLAAVVAIAGITSTKDIGLAPRTPTWFFHNQDDGTVSVKGSTGFYTSLTRAADITDTKITIYEKGGHNSWNKTYDLSGMNKGLLEFNFGTSYKKDVRPLDQYDISIYDWMLEYSK